jgi:hypothetical protein
VKTAIAAGDLHQVDLFAAVGSRVPEQIERETLCVNL